MKARRSSPFQTSAEDFSSATFAQRSKPLRSRAQRWRYKSTSTQYQHEPAQYHIRGLCSTTFPEHRGWSHVQKNFMKRLVKLRTLGAHSDDVDLCQHTARHHNKAQCYTTSSQRRGRISRSAGVVQSTFTHREKIHQTRGEVANVRPPPVLTLHAGSA